jgi:hypothetical protein
MLDKKAENSNTLDTTTEDEPTSTTNDSEVEKNDTHVGARFVPASKPRCFTTFYNGPWPPQHQSKSNSPRPERHDGPGCTEEKQIAMFADSVLSLPTDPLTIRLRTEVENLDPIPGPKTVGSENYSQILDAFTKRGWAGFEDAFDSIVSRGRADYVKVKRDLLREPVFSLKAQGNMLRLAKAFTSGSTPEEQRAALFPVGRGGGNRVGAGPGRPAGAAGREPSRNENPGHLMAERELRHPHMSK